MNSNIDFILVLLYEAMVLFEKSKEDKEFYELALEYLDAANTLAFVDEDDEYSFANSTGLNTNDDINTIIEAVAEVYPSMVINDMSQLN